MAIRNFDSQTYHDRVIDIAAGRLTGSFTVYTNPGGQQRTRIGNLYPDIILTQIGNNTVQYIIEVETVETVSHSEVQQWKQYSTLGGTFYLLVPSQLREKAETICRTYGIYSVKFGTYWVDAQNVLQLNYE